MDAAEYTIVGLNLVMAVALGWLLARRLAKAGRRPAGTRRTMALLILVYLAECIAFSTSMGTNVLTIGLAFLWGFLLASSSRAPAAAIRRSPRLVLLLSAYTSLPAVSLLSVPIVMALAGRPILSAEAGAQFGIPDFVPWPANTILGFCAAVAFTAVIAKVAVTMGMVRLLARSDRVASPDQGTSVLAA